MARYNNSICTETELLLNIGQNGKSKHFLFICTISRVQEYETCMHGSLRDHLGHIGPGSLILVSWHHFWQYIPTQGPQNGKPACGTLRSKVIGHGSVRGESGSFGSDLV